MNFRQVFYIIFLIVIQKGSNAQSTMLMDWGKQYECKGAPTSEVRLIATDKNYYYLLDENFYIIPKKNVTRHKVIRFDHNNNNFIDEHDAGFRFKKKRLTISNVIATKSGVYAVAPFYEFGGNYNFITSKFINGKFEQVESKFEHEFKSGKEPINTTSEFNLDIEGGVSVSNDSSKVIFVNQKSLYDQRRKNEQIVIAIFDDTLNLLWDRTIELPYKDPKFCVRNVKVDDLGKNVYVSGYVINGKKNDNREYKIFHVTKELQREVKLDFSLDYFISSVDLLLDSEKNKAKVVGAYSNKETGKLKGVFYGEMTEGKEGIDVDYYHEFDFSQSNIAKRDLRKKKYTISLSELRMYDSNNIQLLIELRGPKHNKSSSSNYQRTIHDYGQSVYYAHTRHLYSMIFCLLNKKGELMNSIFLERDQWVNDKKGYAFCNFKKETYIFFDTKLTKEEAKKYHLQHAYFDTLTKYVIIGKNGELVNENILFRSSDSKMNFNDIMAFTINNSLYIGGKNSNYEFKIIDTEAVYNFGTVKVDKLKHLLK